MGILSLLNLLACGAALLGVVGVALHPEAMGILSHPLACVGVGLIALGAYRVQKERRARGHL